MGGELDQKELLMSLNYSVRANDLSYGYAYDLNQVIPMTNGGTDIHASPLALSQWIDGPKTPHSYVDFLRQNTEKAPAADVLETIGSPVGGKRAIEGISEVQGELLLKNAGKASMCGPDNYALESEYGELKLSAHTMNTSYHEASASERFSRPHDRHAAKYSSSGFESHAQQNRTFMKQEPVEDDCKVFQHQARETMRAPRFQPHPSVPKLRASGSDRYRKQRIDESIKTLQELLPNSAERDQANTLDDTIDHIKFLQLQIKQLSRSRLGGEPTSNPFVYFEGYGHFHRHEQTLNEPFEEIMGKLIEVNPTAAGQLLENKGLYVMPWALVEGLRKAK